MELFLFTTLMFFGNYSILFVIFSISCLHLILLFRQIIQRFATFLLYTILYHFAINLSL